MESSILTEGDVSKELDRFVLVELYVDGPGEDKKANAKLEVSLFNESSQPLYAILAPDGREVARISGRTRGKAEFLGFLRDGLAKATGRP